MIQAIKKERNAHNKLQQNKNKLSVKSIKIIKSKT
jgi:hypothetical protein